MGVMTALKTIFSFSKAGDTAVDIVRKVTGTDGMTDREKADFVLEYLKVTSNQSVARRILALGFFALYSVFCLTWLGAYFFASGEQLDHIAAFIKEMLFTPLNLIVGFYFTINIVKSLGK